MDPTAAVCQICGESLGECPVLCDRCLTPHHADCFGWAGMCSTFGCGGLRYRKDADSEPVEVLAAPARPPSRLDRSRRKASARSAKERPDSPRDESRGAGREDPETASRWGPASGSRKRFFVDRDLLSQTWLGLLREFGMVHLGLYLLFGVPWVLWRLWVLMESIVSPSEAAVMFSLGPVGSLFFAGAVVGIGVALGRFLAWEGMPAWFRRRFRVTTVFDGPSETVQQEWVLAGWIFPTTFCHFDDVRALALGKEKRISRYRFQELVTVTHGPLFLILGDGSQIPISSTLESLDPEGRSEESTVGALRFRGRKIAKWMKVELEECPLPGRSCLAGFLFLVGVVLAPEVAIVILLAPPVIVAGIGKALGAL